MKFRSWAPAITYRDRRASKKGSSKEKVAAVAPLAVSRSNSRSAAFGGGMKVSGTAISIASHEEEKNSSTFADSVFKPVALVTVNVRLIAHDETNARLPAAVSVRRITGTSRLPVTP